MIHLSLLYTTTRQFIWYILHTMCVLAGVIYIKINESSYLGETLYTHLNIMYRFPGETVTIASFDFNL